MTKLMSIEAPAGWLTALAASGFACAFALGCASGPPPRQLLDARAAYNEASLGKAAELAPAELHTAKETLNAAEQAYQDDPESAQTYALSYVALRTAQLVQAQAATKAAKADLEKAQHELDQLQADEMARTRNELNRAKQALSDKNRELAVRNEQLSAAGQQLQTKEEQLAEEKAARAAAEEREREAMRKLAAAAALNVKEEPRGTVIVLPGSVLFTSGKYELTPEAQQKLGLVADTIAPQAGAHEIVVEGHTDSKGTPESNQVLSENRARAVMDLLIARGVPAQSITSVGIGQVRPVADNSTAEGRANNRRVEIIIKPREAR
jgi:outer membrane protein OmpA-like peptidoglycan-associated protein